MLPIRINLTPFCSGDLTNTSLEAHTDSRLTVWMAVLYDGCTAGRKGGRERAGPVCMATKVAQVAAIVAQTRQD